MGALGTGNTGGRRCGKIPPEMEATLDWTVIPETALVVLNGLVLWVWKPWTNAYAGEKGKNLARKEDLDKIVSEVRQVTETQKAIEARISGNLWREQWVLNQRHETYGRVLNSVERLQMALSRGHIADKVGTPEAMKLFVKAIGDVPSCISDFITTSSLARIYASSEVRSGLDKITNYASQPGEDLVAGISALLKMRDDLIAAARKDLLVGPLA